MTQSLPPYQLANIDQWRARLSDLTAQVRNHHTVGCDWPTLCCGTDALAWLNTHPYELPTLLAIALVDRAQPMPDPAPAAAGPRREDVLQVVTDQLARCATARLMAILGGDELNQGHAYWVGMDAEAVVKALETIGVLATQTGA